MYYANRAQVTLVFYFFFNDTATTEIYTLSLHDALPIWGFYNKRWNYVENIAKIMEMIAQQ